MGANPKPTPLIAESGKLTSAIKKKLDMLADELSTNYVTASFGKEDKDKVKLEDLFNKSDINRLSQNAPRRTDKPSINNLKLKHRNIVVIGGGATHDAYKCIPLGIQITKKLKADENKKIDEELIIKRFHDNLKEFGLEKKKPDFENTLSLLSQWYYQPPELRNKIAEFVDFRYPPSLFYEIIAHMFKHSFIDVIINFNFDELLDNAIEEELGKENYFHVVSDGDCVPINDIMIDGRLKIPVYIKPHGTFKHKSSLRFTNRHYLDMPEQIKALLMELVEGNCGFEDRPKENKSGLTLRGFSAIRDEITVRTNIEEENNIELDKIRVNLVCVGFNLESMEFNEILDKHLSGGSRIYHFVKEKSEHRSKPYFLKNVLPEFYKREYKKKHGQVPDKHFINKKEKDKNEKSLHDDLYHRIAIDSFNKINIDNGITTPLCEMFSYLWRRVYDQFKIGFRPRSIGQHEIISYLFYNPKYGEEITPGGADKKDGLTIDLKRQYVDNYKKDRKCLADAYFLDRTMVEIAIAINRNNGIVELAELLGDRVGKYFALYKAAFDNKHKNNKNAYSIYDLIDQFKKKSEKQNKDEDFYPKGVLELDTSILDGRGGLIYRAEKSLDRIKNNSTALANCTCLKKWIDVEEADDYILIQTFLNKFLKISSKTRHNDKSNDTVLNKIIPVLLYRLFTSELLSKTFIKNFKTNYNKIIYNGKYYQQKDLKRMGSEYCKGQSGPKMIDELERLFDKSSIGAISYFSIHPKFNNPQNFLLESFSKSKILHTNLALDYKFRELFLKRFDDWDLLLIIAEKTSLLGFLQEKDLLDRPQFRNKQIFIINSYEAIKQFHPNLDAFYRERLDFHKTEQKKKPSDYNGKTPEKQAFGDKINELISLQAARYNEIINRYTVNRQNTTVDVRCLPAMQHNHHMMVFIKKTWTDESTKYPAYYGKKGDKQYRLEMMGALYMYRQGFSNSINPIFIPGDNDTENNKSVTNDFLRLLRIFSKIHRRAELFKGLPESEDLDVDFKYQLNQIV